jgi:hypothetical protein
MRTNIYLTIASRIKINVGPNANINHAKEALITSLKFLLIEYLDSKNAVFGDFPVIYKLDIFG